MVLRRDDWDGIVRSRVKELPEVISIKLNEEWKKIIAELQTALEQPKASTVIKQSLALTHAKVLHDPEVSELLAIVFENKRKNKRLGYDIEYE